MLLPDLSLVCSQLQRRELHGSYQCAIAACRVVGKYVEGLATAAQNSILRSGPSTSLGTSMHSNSNTGLGLSHGAHIQSFGNTGKGKDGCVGSGMHSVAGGNDVVSSVSSVNNGINYVSSASAGGGTISNAGGNLSGGVNSSTISLVSMGGGSNNSLAGMVSNEPVLAGVLIEQLHEIGRQLIAARPTEMVMGNIVRRVVHKLRREIGALLPVMQSRENDKLENVGYSLYKILDKNESELNSKSLDTLIVPKKVLDSLEEEVQDLLEEIQSLNLELSEHSVEHIHAKYVVDHFFLQTSETILTAGYSKTVLEFFMRAHELKRKFTVFVVETSPNNLGHKMALELSKLKIDVIMITDSAVFAMMPKVNKVIVGTHAVLANGGVISYTGSLNIAIAAREHRIPFVVLTGLYKLCPLFAFDQDTFNDSGAPSDVVQFEDASM